MRIVLVGLHETQVKIETQILPQLADTDLNADPTGELSQTLSLSADGIKQYFKTHKLVAKKRTSSSWRGRKSDANCPTSSGASYPDYKEESLQPSPPPIPTEDQEFEKEFEKEMEKGGWSVSYLPRHNANPEVDADNKEFADRWFKEKGRL